MEVAQALSKEKFMHSSTSALLVNTGIDGSVTGGPENDEDAEKEASLLLDAAVTLCAIAAKKVGLVIRFAGSLLRLKPLFDKLHRLKMQLILVQSLPAGEPNL